MSFVELGLSDELLKAVTEAGYTEPTPIQAQAIPTIFMGRDVLGCAQTGTGKTAGFTLPMIDILAQGRAKARMPRSLILEPTRELAAQVAESFDKYGKHHKLSKVLLIGGESMGKQIAAMDRGVDVLIATPGRLLDLFDRGRLLLTGVKILVIDEADRMLDMGFIPDVERIVKLLSPIRQTLFFSATMPSEIRKLADAFLMNPKEISVASPSLAAETVEQFMVAVKHGGCSGTQGGMREKRATLRSLLKREDPVSAIIFCNRKRDVDVVARSLKRHGFDAAQLHGDMAQPARMEVLRRFKNSEVKLLVCSDVAARGLDILAVSHVFNFDIPTHSEDYVHRIGRTGRAGRKGRAISISVPEDGKYVAGIERLLGGKIPPLHLDGVVESKIDNSAVAAEQRGPRDRGKQKEEKETQVKSETAAGEVHKRGRRENPEGRNEKTAVGMGGRRENPEGGNEKTAVGMGDHMPAFMQRKVKSLK